MMPEVAIGRVQERLATNRTCLEELAKTCRRFKADDGAEPEYERE